MAEEKKYRSVKIHAGLSGWGGPLIIEPKDGRDLIYCVTGNGIHPVARKIADLTGGTAFDGFQSKRDFEEIAVAVIDCGGTARVGIYPMKGIPTIDVHPTKPSGPLFAFIKEEIFVSGVSLDEIELVPLESEDQAEPEADEPLDLAAEISQTVDEVKEKTSGFFKRLFGGG